MTSYSIKAQVSGLLVILAITYVASAIGALASINAGEFYAQLVQPQWAPPANVFGPVWTVLYTLMGVAAWWIWREGGLASNAVALGLYGAQLVANSLWSWLFFSWNLGAVALIELVILWVLILLTLLMFWRVKKLAGLLLVPYLAWVSFAGLLNYSLWQLNPQLL